MNIKEAKERFQPNLDNIIEELEQIEEVRQIVVRPERTYCDVFVVYDKREFKRRRLLCEQIGEITMNTSIIDRRNKPDLNIWVKTRFDGPLAVFDWYEEEVYNNES